MPRPEIPFSLTLKENFDPPQGGRFEGVVLG
jgi:hypothetical protein